MKWETREGQTWESIARAAWRLAICTMRGHKWIDVDEARNCDRCYQWQYPVHYCVNPGHDHRSAQ